jgi:hypothetical protein
MNNDANLMPGTFLVRAEDIEKARQMTDTFYRERHPEKVRALDYWYHHELSPTGQLPATHYYCHASNMNDADWQEQTEYIVEHEMPVVTERTTLDIWEYAASKGLQRIE